MCHLDGDPKRPDIESNIILSVSVRMFSDKINILTD